MTVHRISVTPEQAERDFVTVVREQLRHDRAAGFNTWGTSDTPVMLVWSPRIFEFLEVLESVVSYQPARGICREVGYRSGFEGAEVTAKLLGAPSGRVDVLFGMVGVLSGAGWGVSELAYDDESKAIRWRFPRGTAVGEAARRKGRRANPACAFFEGFGGGWVQGSLGLKVEFLEAECLAIGGSACTFESRTLE
jgi:predicted hydrocarbon binding protein